MSASLGINDLVKANICIMFSPSTNFTDYVQSKKRIDRIGQTKKPLFYNLYCKDTVEEKILKTIKKGQNFDDKMFNKYMESR
jgi:SNF2 family DNA or RNA helicase